MASIIPKLTDLAGRTLKEARPKLQTFLFYAKVELVPPRFSELPEVKNGITKLLNGYRKGTWKQLTVKQALLNVLVATEVAGWFWIGECIGKRHIIGYKLD